MKKVLVIGGAVVVGVSALVGGIFALVVWLTGGAVDASEEFLALISEERIEEAYDAAATALRAQQNLAGFDGAVRALGLTGYESVRWSSREIVNDRTSLEGSVTTVDGGTIPLSMSLVKEGGQWRVLGLEGASAGVSVADAGNDRIAAPDDESVQRLVHQTMLSFSDALRQEDFAPFYGSISDLWKDQTTPEELARAFQDLVAARTDFSNIRDLSPVLVEPPGIDANNLLSASGFYASQPYRADFDLRYVYEAPSWRLVGISVTAQERLDVEPAPGEDPAPTALGQGTAYTISENPDLVGRLGRVVVAFPDGAMTQARIGIRSEAGGEESASGYGGLTTDLLPGSYEVTISGVRIPGVEVRSRNDTRVAVGILRVTVGSSTRTAVYSGGEEAVSAYGNMEFGLPAGDYEVEVSGQRVPVTVGAGETVQF